MGLPGHIMEDLDIRERERERGERRERERERDPERERERERASLREREAGKHTFCSSCKVQTILYYMYYIRVQDCTSSLV